MNDIVNKLASESDDISDKVDEKNVNLIEIIDPNETDDKKQINSKTQDVANFVDDYLINMADGIYLWARFQKGPIKPSDVKKTYMVYKIN